MAETPADLVDPGWWAQEPEYWELLGFDGGYDEAGLPLDRCAQDRREVLEALIVSPGPAAHGFATFLLEQEILFHRHCWGFGRSIELAALLVAEHGRAEDVWLLFRAIMTSFDTWCGLPHRLLFAAGGRDRALAYVAATDPELRDHVLERLRELAADDEDDAGALIARRRRYYAEVLGGLAPGRNVVRTSGQRRGPDRAPL